MFLFLFPYHMSVIHIGRNRNAVAVRAKLFANDLSICLPETMNNKKNINSCGRVHSH